MPKLGDFVDISRKGLEAIVAKTGKPVGAGDIQRLGESLSNEMISQCNNFVKDQYKKITDRVDEIEIIEKEIKKKFATLRQEIDQFGSHLAKREKDILNTLISKGNEISTVVEGSSIKKIELLIQEALKNIEAKHKSIIAEVEVGYVRLTEFVGELDSKAVVIKESVADIGMLVTKKVEDTKEYMIGVTVDWIVDNFWSILRRIVKKVLARK